VKLRSNVLASVQAHTHFLDSPRIRESLGSSDFGFDDLKNKPTTVYLILPADRLKTFDRWLRLLIQQAITVNARDITNKPEKPVLFLLDEMASLGRLSMVEQAYGLMAGFGMQLWGIVQDLSQLERIYGDGWQTFISNSGVIQYFGSRDKTTAEYFSTLCGVTTIRIMSLTYALGSVFGTAFSSSYGPGGTTTTSGSNESESHTHTIGSNESQRQLAYPDELMVLKNNDQIIFVENLDPIRSTKIRWYQDASLRALGVNLHPEIETQVIDPPPDQIVAPPKQAQVPPIPAFIHSVTQAVTNSPVSISVREFLKPELLPAQPVEPQAIVQPKPEPYVVKRHEQGDTSYAIYSDNTIQMTTPTSSRRFQSMADLKTHLASLKAPAEKDNA
jgi:type IV secretory pathway TraG/TraD family ATPase VirD4